MKFLAERRRVIMAVEAVGELLRLIVVLGVGLVYVALLSKTRKENVMRVEVVEELFRLIAVLGVGLALGAIIQSAITEDAKGECDDRKEEATRNACE